MGCIALRLVVQRLYHFYACILNHGSRVCYTVTIAQKNTGKDPMSFDSLRKLFEFDAPLHTVIEPASRFEPVNGRLVDCLEVYKPHVIVKIGLGNPAYIESIMEHSNALVVVVEPSVIVLQSFYNAYGNKQWMDRLYTIAGNFSQFPVDYYKADMLICIDCLDLLDTGMAVDEFRRSLQFEGIFFFAGFVLPNEDVEGIFDEIAHVINPLHTDYYLEDDLKTFMTLNEFGIVKLNTQKINMNILLLADYLQTRSSELEKLIEEHKETLTALYDLRGDGTVTLPYMVAAFIRQKPSQEEAL